MSFYDFKYRKKKKKKKKKKNWPIKTKGNSTTWPPIQVKIKKVPKNKKKINWEKKENLVLFIFLKNTGKNKINKEQTKAITPNNLLGIERKIA